MSARLLRRGLRLCFAEMDVFWMHDPQLVEDASLDLQPSEQHVSSDGGLDLNVGFFLAQPTAAATRLFAHLSLWSQRDARPADLRVCWDQVGTTGGAIASLHRQPLSPASRAPASPPL